MQDVIETSTVYITPSGEVEIPGPSIPLPPELKTTAKSYLAPQWLVFPNHIINTQRINGIRRGDDRVYIDYVGGSYSILVSNINETWSALQKVFADGLPNN